MANKKTEIRFFTIADYYEEENWLREEHRSGWKLVKMSPPCFFTFEECMPEDVIYRLDFKNNQQKPDYMQMVKDFGWEYCAKCLGWLYFRKPAAAADTAEDTEIFSDNESRLEMVEHIFKTRMLPLMIIFLCVVAPNLIRSAGLENGKGFFIAYTVLFALYVYLLLHCGLKLRKIRQALK